MSLEFATGVAINFESNGNVVLDNLFTPVQKLDAAVTELTTRVAALDAAISGLSRTVSAASTDFGAYAGAMNASTAATDRAAASARSAEAAYRGFGAAAAAATGRREEAATIAMALPTQGSRAISLGSANRALALASGAAMPVGTQTLIPPPPGVARPIPGTGGPYYAQGAANAFYAMGGGGGPGAPGGGAGGPGGPGGGGGGSNFNGLFQSPKGLGGAPAEFVHAGIHAAKLGGEVAIGLAGDSIYEAAKLQTQLQLIRAGTGANDKQMERIKQSAYDLSSKTAQSVTQSAQVISVLATSGINDPKMLTPQFINKVGMFADLQYLKSGGRVSFDESTKQAIQIAHQNQAYTPDAIGKLLETVSKLSFMMPDSLSKYLTQSTQYTPLFRRLGVPQDEQLVFGTFMDRMGMGKGRGGTALANFLGAFTQPLQLTGHMQAGKLNALKELRILNPDGSRNREIFREDKNGNLVIDPLKAMVGINQKLEEDVKGLRGTARMNKQVDDIALFQKAFGIQGARFSNLATPEGVALIMQIFSQLKRMPSIETSQSGFMANIQGRTQQAKSNFQSLATEVGWQALPGVTKGAKDLADALHGAQTWLHQHADAEKAFGRDIFGGIVTTEKFLVSHKSTWMTLESDIKGAYQGAKDAGPAILDTADALTKLFRATSAVFGFMWNTPVIGGKAQFGGANALYQQANSGDLGGVDPNTGMPLAMPTYPTSPTTRTRAPGHTGPPMSIIMHQPQFHGIQDVEDFQNALGGIQHRSARTGNQVPHPGLAPVLTTSR